MGLIILSIVFSMLRPKIYNYMGWQMTTNSTQQQPPNFAPPPSNYGGFRRSTAEEIRLNEDEMLRQKENVGEYQYQEKPEDYDDRINVFADDDEVDPRDNL